MHRKSWDIRRYTSAVLMAVLLYSSEVGAAAYTSEGSTDVVEICGDKVYEISKVIGEYAFTEDVNADEDIAAQEISEAVLEDDQSTVEELETFSTIENNTNLFANVSSFSELQNMIENASEDTVISITNNIIFEEPILIENGVSITIQTDPAAIQTNPNDISVLIQQNSERHFLVTSGSTLKIENITLNGSDRGGGVVVSGEGTTLIMNGNSYIQLCRAERGGALELKDNAVFVMNDGIIERNNAALGGGLYLRDNASFTMKKGIISGNEASVDGGGVYLAGNSTFIMESGGIEGNTAVNNGAGLYVSKQSHANITGMIRHNVSFWGIGGGIYTEDHHNIITDSSTVFFANSPATAAVPFQGRASDFPNIRFAASYGEHPINNRDINNNLDMNSSVRHSVTVHYVNQKGEEITDSANHSVTNGYEFHVAENLPVIDGFKALHYVVAEDDTQHDLTKIQTITGDMTIFVYHASTILTVSIPENVEFFVNETTGGAVVSGIYDIINESELPLKVSFVELTPIYLDGINLVPEAAANNDLHLNIEFFNGFSRDISNIIPNYTYKKILGVLGGTFIGDNDSTGSFSISGQYIGSITAIPKRPRIEFMFTFELDKEGIIKR